MSKKGMAEILALAGITLSPQDLAATAPVELQEPAQDMGQWEAQSVLASLNWPYPDLVSVKCWSCGEKFLTNYEPNVYCSMKCHKTELEKRGLTWNPKRTFYEQWGNLEPPLMIPPEAIKAMRRLLRLLDQEKIVQTYSPEPDYEESEESEDSVSLDPPIPDSDPEIQEEPDSGPDQDFLNMLNAL